MTIFREILLFYGPHGDPGTARYREYSVNRERYAASLGDAKQDDLSVFMPNSKTFPKQDVCVPLSLGKNYENQKDSPILRTFISHIVF